MTAFDMMNQIIGAGGDGGGGIHHAPTAHGVNNYTLTHPDVDQYMTPALIADGEILVVLLGFLNANTGNVTLNINSLGARTVVDPAGNHLRAGAITNGSHHFLFDNGVHFVLLSTQAVFTLAQLANDTNIERFSTGIISLPRGGTGASDAAGARANLGLTPLTGGNLFPTPHANPVWFLTLPDTGFAGGMGHSTGVQSYGAITQNIGTLPAAGAAHNTPITNGISNNVALRRLQQQITATQEAALSPLIQSASFNLPGNSTQVNIAFPAITGGRTIREVGVSGVGISLVGGVGLGEIGFSNVTSTNVTVHTTSALGPTHASGTVMRVLW